MKTVRCLCLVGLALAALPGCAPILPPVENYSKQEAVVHHDPPVHLATRGARRGQTVRCQLFLLTASRSLWLSHADLKQPDGAVLKPTQLRSLDAPPPRRGPAISVGFGVGLGRRSSGHGHHGADGGSGWTPGAGVGVGVPIWRLLGGQSGATSPRSVDLVYELPETRTDCAGCELVVHVATTAKTEEKKPAEGEQVTTREGPAGCPQCQGVKHVPVVFGLSEKLAAGEREKQPENKDDAEQQAKEMVREIYFTLKNQT